MPNLYIILTAMLVLPALLGWGIFAYVVCKMPKKAYCCSMADTMVIGTCLTLTLAMALNFMIPINDMASSTWLVIGLLLLVWNSFFSKNFYFEKSMIQVSAILITIFMVSVLADEWRPNYDTGLYHYPFTTWISESRFIVGLANLSNRYGFNSSISILASVFKLPYLQDLSSLATNWIILIIFLTKVIEVVLNETYKIGRVFTGIVALLILDGLFLHHAAGLANDLASTLWAMYLLILCFQVLDFDSTSQSTKVQYVMMAGIFAVPLSIVTKISQIMIAPVALVAVWKVWELGLDLKKILKPKLFVFPMLMASLWLTRGFGLSGCLIFPISATCSAEPSWALGKTTTENLANTILAWGRGWRGGKQGPWLNGWDWLDNWSKPFANSLFFRLYLYTSVMFLVIILVRNLYLLLRRSPRNEMKKYQAKFLALFFIVMFCGALWFFKAPDKRFMFTALFGSAGVLFTWVWVAIGADRFAPKYLSTIIMSALALKAAHVGIKEGVFDHRLLGEKYASLPRAPFKTATNHQGITFYIPTRSDQCWKLPRPCVSRLNEDLTLDESGFLTIMTAGKRYSGKQNNKSKG